MEPETRLVHAIVQQAVLDLFASTPSGAAEQGIAERRDALAFLTATQGTWAQRRAELCDLIDLNPDNVRAEIVAILEGAEPRIKIGRGIDRARALWAEQNTRPSHLPRPPKPPKPAPLATRSTLTSDDVAAFVRARGEVTIAEIMQHFEVSDVVAIGRLRTLKNRGDVISPKPGTYRDARISGDGTRPRPTPIPPGSTTASNFHLILLPLHLDLRSALEARSRRISSMSRWFSFHKQGCPPGRPCLLEKNRCPTIPRQPSRRCSNRSRC